VPTCPGVYRMHAPDGAIVYVGKAKSLRRRLSQYRNAKRVKKHAKMRAIVKSAASVSITACASELEAELLEEKLIRELRPKWNVMGAFSFLYPLVGLGEGARGELVLAYSTLPEERADVAWFGAYRSREITGEAFFALVRLLSRVGHRSKSAPRAKKARTYAFEIRQVPRGWRELWSAFLRGESRRALDVLVLDLLERPAARRDATTVEEDLHALDRFHKHEALPLRRARDRVGVASHLVGQAERDALFIRARRLRAEPLRAAG